MAWGCIRFRFRGRVYLASGMCWGAKKRLRGTSEVDGELNWGEFILLARDSILMAAKSVMRLVFLERAAFLDAV